MADEVKKQNANGLMNDVGNAVDITAVAADCVVSGTRGQISDFFDSFGASLKKACHVAGDMAYTFAEQLSPGQGEYDSEDDKTENTDDKSLESTGCSIQ